MVGSVLACRTAGTNHRSWTRLGVRAEAPILLEENMRSLLVLAGALVLILASPLNASGPMTTFADEWKGVTVVLKKPLYTFGFYATQPGGHVGVTRIAPGKGIYYLFTAARPTPHTIADTDVQRLAKQVRADAGSTTTRTQQGTGQLETKNDVRPLPVLRVITYDAGTDLLVKQIVYGGSSNIVLKIELTLPNAPAAQPVTHLFVEWPAPFSPEFVERPKVEALMAEFFERAKR
jgi:hypothetical protein